MEALQVVGSRRKHYKEQKHEQGLEAEGIAGKGGSSLNLGKKGKRIFHFRISPFRYFSILILIFFFL